MGYVAGPASVATGKPAASANTLAEARTSFKCFNVRSVLGINLHCSVANALIVPCLDVVVVMDSGTAMAVTGIRMSACTVHCENAAYMML